MWELTRTFRDVVSTLFEAYAESVGKPLWGDKTPQHALYMPEIDEHFREAKFIHLLRDGRDVAESTARVGIGPKSIYRIAKRWKKYVLAAQSFQETIDQSRWLEVHYEELVRNQVGELSRICKFLGVAFHRQDAFQTESHLQSLYLKQMEHHGGIGMGVTQNKIGVYRNRFSRREIQVFEMVAGDALQSTGYCTDLPDGKPINRREATRFLLQDYVYRFLRKLKSRRDIRLFKKQIAHEWQFRWRRFLRSRVLK